MIPLDSDLTVVVVRVQVLSAYAGDVDLIEDGVICVDGEVLALADLNIQPGLFGELPKVAGLHHVLSGDGEAVVSKAVQSLKPREVVKPVKVGELFNGAVTGLGRRLTGEGKVTDLCGVGTALQFDVHHV